MSTRFVVRTNMLARIAAPVLLAAGLCACSSMPDWVDPTSWFGSDSPADQTSDAAPDAAQTASAGQTPDLASIPPKPTPPTTPDEQKQVTESLAADRTQAQYSAEALEGGTEPAAPPPPDATAAAPVAPAPAPGPADQTASASTAPPDTTSAASPADGAASQSQAPSGTATADASASQIASTGSSGTAAPAAAAMTNAPPAGNMQASFEPSHAPALDPSVAHYVPQAILSRYQQSAAAAAAPGVEGLAATTPPPRHRHHRKAKAVQTVAPDATAPAQ